MPSTVGKESVARWGISPTTQGEHTVKISTPTPNALASIIGSPAAHIKSAQRKKMGKKVNGLVPLSK